MTKEQIIKLDGPVPAHCERTVLEGFELDVGRDPRAMSEAELNALGYHKRPCLHQGGSDMPYIAHDTNVIYVAADTAAAALAEAEKDLRNRLPTEDIDKVLKSLEVHEATTALVNDSNSWVKWAYLKNGVACTPTEANDEDYRLGIAAATDGK